MAFDFRILDLSEEQYEKTCTKYQNAVRNNPILDHIEIDVDNGTSPPNLDLHYLKSKINGSDSHIKLNEIEQSATLAHSLIYVAQTHHFVSTMVSAFVGNKDPDHQLGTLLVTSEIFCFFHDFEYLLENPERYKATTFEVPIVSFFSDAPLSALEQQSLLSKFKSLFPVLCEWITQNTGTVDTGSQN